MEEKEEFEIEKIIPVNILEDAKQMRVTIPKEIVEDFGINPERHQFGWMIEKDRNSNKVTIMGKFLLKKQNGKKED